MRTLESHITAACGRRWRLLLWYIEACIAGAAIWALARDARPQTLVTALAYGLLCGAALALPAHLLRLCLTGMRVSPTHRRLALQLFLAFAAAATTATLSTERGWAASVCILLAGNALWALELELREEASTTSRRSDQREK